MDAGHSSSGLQPHDSSGQIRSLFDCSLPEEKVERIMHFMSMRASHVYPQNFVDASDVLVLFGSSEHVSTEASKQFFFLALIQPDLHWWYTRCERESKPRGLIIEDP